MKALAFPLNVGIFAPFICAVFVSKTFFLIWLERRPQAKELAI